MFAEYTQESFNLAIFGKENLFYQKLKQNKTKLSRGSACKATSKPIGLSVDFQLRVSSLSFSLHKFLVCKKKKKRKRVFPIYRDTHVNV